MEMTPQLRQFVSMLSASQLPDNATYCAKVAYGIHITVREERMSPGMVKYHLIDLPFDAVLHHFTEIDTGDPHDHPFSFDSYVLKGSYIEKKWFLKNEGKSNFVHRHREQGQYHRVDAETVHIITALPQGDCWTLILPQQWKQQPSFYRFGEIVIRRQWDEKEWREVV